MKIWMSYINKKGKAIISLFGFLAFIIVFNLGVIMATTIIFHQSTIMLFFCMIFVVAVDIFGAVRVGSTRARDNLIFLRDNFNSLFVVDITKYIRYRRGLFGLYSMESQREEILNNLISQRKYESYLTQESSLHGLEIEIECVESMKQRKDGFTIVCRVIYPNHTKGRTSYFVKDGYADQDALIRDLESRKLSSSDARVITKNHTGQLIVSIILLLVDLALCVMSHPILGILSVSLYFYFLAALVPLFCFFLYIVLLMRRGL